MANPRLIKKRIGSVNNIKKITKALEMVAASKVQKAQEKAVSSKPFADTTYGLVNSFADKNIHIPLLRQPENIRSRLLILVTTNRGLCGSLNTNITRYVTNFLAENTGIKTSFITVGKKGRNFALSNGELTADLSDYNPTDLTIPVITKLITDSFINETVDEVYIVYSDFVSALTQTPKIKKILPFSQENLEGEEKNQVAGFIADKEEDELLTELLPFYLEVQIKEALTEAEASEHSARMLAMKNAADNAGEISTALSLEYNNARQQAITTELSDIVTAKKSLKKDEN